MVTALEPIVEACHGVWVAHGDGDADRAMVDSGDCVRLPAESPQYRLRRVWLDSSEQTRYYDGFANQGLWPLCHAVHVAPIFRAEDYETYRAVNDKFARAVSEEVREGQNDAPLIFVHDYHFALAPQMLRRRRADATIVTFWHIPWPHHREYAVCPWRRELIAGLLGSTLLGFQTDDDRENFLGAAERFADCAVDHESGVVTHRSGETAVRTYPISVEWPSRWAASAPSVAECRNDVRKAIGASADLLLGVGVDRLDYTKGLEEKFAAVERLLERRPDLRGRFAFLQIAEPSRQRLPSYIDLAERVRTTVDRINARFGCGNWKPIVFCDSRHEPAAVFRAMRAADFCYVGSLHDGMNLVAKEFVAARDDQRGVLILSEFAGAARELASGLIVNPYDIEAAAGAMERALSMTAREQSFRMRSLRTVVASSNVYGWMKNILTDAIGARPRVHASVGRTAWGSGARTRSAYATGSHATPSSARVAVNVKCATRLNASN